MGSEIWDAPQGVVSNQLVSLASREEGKKQDQNRFSQTLFYFVSNQLVSLASREGIVFSGLTQLEKLLKFPIN